MIGVLVAYGVVVTVLLLIALAGNGDVAAENRELRKQLLQNLHPSTRRTTR